ncbi:ClpP/crotonase-like domain-containing protein [Colletotrichum phormii]|uniref:ClpP/crotonase-like domain-containing protein n=1 Tax=Colletotrichum phormii TaxID=359342 RepID=A0AAJ0EAX2_9PEZI|nr:ClpP/crotonase-like domain-containing protein [Colletotrichum phormii]KAK1624420.1 ClpP/crotonase-like domain-containing protein [Colletotrichum phormii]
MSHNPLPQIIDLYSSLNYQDIVISHVPCDAPAVTKVIVVTLNRPQRHNAVNGNILEELFSVFNIIDNDDRVRAVVLTGAGKSFCAGMDLSGGPEGLMKIKQNPDAMNQWKDPAFYLPKLVGLSKANHIVTTGNTYTASDPIVSGMFSKLLPTPEETVRYAIDLATEIAENTSITSTKLMRDMMLYCPDTPEGTHDLDS